MCELVVNSDPDHTSMIYVPAEGLGINHHDLFDFPFTERKTK